MSLATLVVKCCSDRAKIILAENSGVRAGSLSPVVVLLSIESDTTLVDIDTTLDIKLREQMPSLLVSMSKLFV